MQCAGSENQMYKKVVKKLRKMACPIFFVAFQKIDDQNIIHRIM